MVFIIVGVDAGDTSAMAVVSLGGKVVHVESRKHWPRGDLVEKISLYSPAVIACDTNPTSGFARSLKRSFGARLLFPKKSMTEHDKQKMASKTGVKLSNKHERDALAAALKAYHQLENKLRQAGKKARKKGGDEKFVEGVQKKVLRGEKMRHAIGS